MTQEEAKRAQFSLYFLQEAQKHLQKAAIHIASLEELKPEWFRVVDCRTRIGAIGARLTAATEAAGVSAKKASVD